MPKNFNELSSRQKNRCLQAYEQSERQTSLQRNATATQRTMRPEELAIDEGVPLSQSPFVGASNASTYQGQCYTDCITEQPGDDPVPGCSTNITADPSNFLRKWKVKHNITLLALSELLVQLQTCGHIDLPKDARTLLQTPRQSNVAVVGQNGSFFHYGLKNASVEQLARTTFTLSNAMVLIDINIDGLPISKSSRSQIWPILGRIFDDKSPGHLLSFPQFVLLAPYSFLCNLIFS